MAQWGFHWKYIAIVCLVFSFAITAGEFINMVNSEWVIHFFLIMSKNGEDQDHDSMHGQ